MTKRNKENKRMANNGEIISNLLDSVIKTEGGYQAAPEDSGNYNSEGKLVGTNFGISAKVLSTHLNRPASMDDMKGLTRQAAKNIYRKNYIKPVTENLGIKPSDPAFYQTLDMVVNHGYSNTVPIIQRALGITVDGKSGPATKKAIEETKKDSKKFNNALVKKRVDFYKDIAKNNPTEGSKFLKGWLNRANTFLQP